MNHHGMVGRACALNRLSTILAVDGARVALISSAAGLGKTRMLSEIAALAGRRGWTVEAVTASPSTTALSLAPFAHLEPVDTPPAVDPGERLARVVGALRGRAAGNKLLVVVDDIQNLDTASAVLLHQLVVHDHARVVLTIRDGHVIPEAAAALIKDCDGISLALEPIDRDASDALVRALLTEGATETVDGAVLDAIWALARGNPLYTRELTTFGREQGSLDRSAHRWHLAADLAPSPLILDDVNRRVAVLRPETGELLRALAVAGSLPLHVIDELGELELLGELEHHDLVDLVEEDDDSLVRLSHPLLGEVLLTLAPSVRLYEARRRIADALIEHDPGRSASILVAARLRLDSGGQDAALFRRAARLTLAHGDPDQALQFSTAALATEDTPATQLLHARGLSAGGEHRAATARFEVLERLTDDPSWLAEVTLHHAKHLAFQCGDPQGAIALLESRLPSLPEQCRTSLRGLLSHLFFLTARLDEAVSVARPLIDGDAPPIESLLGAASAWAAVGEPAKLLELWDRVVTGLDTVSGDDAETTLAIANFAFLRLLALWQTGRAQEGDDPFASVPSARVHDMLAASEHRLEIGAVQQFIRGHLDRAAAIYGELADRMWDSDVPHAAAVAAVQTTVAAQRGDRTAADGARVEGARSASDRVRSPWWTARARLWTAVADGDLEGGISTSLDLVDQHAPEHFHETTSLHDVVRLGRPDLVVGRLAAQAARTGATWWDQACAEHARVAAAADADGLFAIACRFEDGALDLHAAEAFAESLRLLDPEEDQDRFVAASARFANLLDRCGHARTPAITNATLSLTRRELQVARLAAQGLTSREIALRLGTSVRTVGNQLQRVYDKLHIHDRSTLADLFDANRPSR